MRILPILLLIFSCFAYGQELNNVNKLKACPKNADDFFDNCWATMLDGSGNGYVGEFRRNKRHGYGRYTDSKGTYVGEFRDGAYHGAGEFSANDGRKFVGIFENGNFIREAKVNLPNLNNNVANNTDRTDIDRQGQQLAEERRRLEEEKRQQQAEKNNLNKHPTVTDSRRRLALVIGNASYKNSPLRNPTNDADLISKALSSSGFVVSQYHNLTNVKMREVVRAFGENLKRGDVGLFYFSGHAVQYRGKSYLLAIDEDSIRTDEMPPTAMGIDSVLAKMETAKSELNIVIFDAEAALENMKMAKDDTNSVAKDWCGDGPPELDTGSGTRGAAPITAAQGTLLAFASSHGNVVFDGTGRNSPYAKNLAHEILKGGLSLEQLFSEVRRKVACETDGQQLPWTIYSVHGDFFFKTKTGNAEIIRESQVTEERQRLDEKNSQQQTEEKKDNNKTDDSNLTIDNRRRFALVIGNSNYSSLPKLVNAINDARSITQSLRLAGFQVSTHENLDLAGMENAIRGFGEKLGKNDVGLVYFAGHGVQVKGKNYLIPVRENIKKSFEVPTRAMDVDVVLATLEHIKNDLNIVVLDACRSSFPGEARGGNRGLATIEAAKGTFIAFATAPGKEASDGSDSNSPYTKHLARLIAKKGLPLEQVFKEVRKAVVAETNGEQVPWENTSLMGDFYFQK
jgi:uncharacterized caspase-like protein